MTLPSLSDKKGWLRLLMFSNMGSIRAYYTIAKKREILYSDDLFCLPRNILFLQLLDLLSHLSVLNWVFFWRNDGRRKECYNSIYPVPPTKSDLLRGYGANWLLFIIGKDVSGKKSLEPHPSIHPSIHPCAGSAQQICSFSMSNVLAGWVNGLKIFCYNHLQIRERRRYRTGGWLSLSFYDWENKKLIRGMNNVLYVVLHSKSLIFETCFRSAKSNWNAENTRCFMSQPTLMSKHRVYN